MRRSKDFDEYLYEQLQNAEFAKNYFISSMEELDGEPGLDLFDALKNIIRKMGSKEYADLVEMDQSNISRILSQDDIPKLETLNRLVAPFKLKIRLDIEDVA